MKNNPPRRSAPAPRILPQASDVLGIAEDGLLQRGRSASANKARRALAHRYPVGGDVPTPRSMAYYRTLVHLVCSHSLSASFDSREVPSAGEAEGLSSKS